MPFVFLYQQTISYLKIIHIEQLTKPFNMVGLPGILAQTNHFALENQRTEYIRWTTYTIL